MRIPEAVRMADDGGHSPVWARTKRSGGGVGGLFTLIGLLLGAFGALSIVLAGMNGWSFAKGGAKIDAFICSVIAKVHPTAAAAPAAPAAVTATPVAAAAPAPAAPATK